MIKLLYILAKNKISDELKGGAEAATATLNPPLKYNMIVHRNPKQITKQ